MQIFEFRIDDRRSAHQERATITAERYTDAFAIAERMVNGSGCNRVEIYQGSVWLFAAQKSGLPKALQPAMVRKIAFG